MANISDAAEIVEERREFMQQDGGRHATLAAYDGITHVLLNILLELREIKEHIVYFGNEGPDA